MSCYTRVSHSLLFWNKLILYKIDREKGTLVPYVDVENIHNYSEFGKQDPP